MKNNILAALPFRITFAAAIVFIVLEYVILGKFSLFIVGDNISMLPYYLAFFANDVPFANWTPFAAAGTDMVATGYTTLVYQWTFALLPPWLAFQVLVVVPILAGVFGVFGLCRQVFKLDRTASAIAGCAYAILFFRELFFLSSVIGYLPLTLLALHNLLDNKKSGKAWLGVMISGFLIAHSSFITRLVPWPVATYIVWFLIIEKRRKSLDWGIIATFSIAILAARWQDIVALLAYAPLSGLSEARGGGTFDVEMQKAIGEAKSSLLGTWGVAAILLAGFAVSFSSQARRPVSLRLLMALFAFLGLLLAGSLVKVATVTFLPFLSGFNTAYVMQGFGLVVVIAGGLGLQFFLDRINVSMESEAVRTKALLWPPALIVLMLLALNLNSKYQHAKAWVSWGNFHQNTQNPDLLALAKSIRTQGRSARAISFQMHGSLLNSYGIETIEGYHPLTSKRYLALWKKMVEPWRQMDGWQESHGRAETGAMTSILPSTQGGLGWKRTETRPQWRLADFANMNLLSMMNGHYIVSRDRLTDQQLVLVSGPGKSWSSLTQKEKILVNIEANFTGRRPLFIYENPAALPRAYTVNSVRTFNSNDDLLKALGEADMAALANTIFTRKSSLPAGLQLVKTDVVSLLYDTDQMTIEIASSDDPAVLVVSSTYSPFWQCRIDGETATIFPANYAFWGLLLPAGAQQVICYYQPPYLIR